MRRTKIQMQHPHHSTTQCKSKRHFSQLTIRPSLRDFYLRVLHQDCSMCLRYAKQRRPSGQQIM